jgi:hypothetical protein
METIKFETGNVYEMTFITNADLRVPYICVKRTDKTVSFERFENPTERLNKKIKVYNNTEYVLKGDYSMAPMIKASRLVK